MNGRATLYETITNDLITELAKGVVPLGTAVGQRRGNAPAPPLERGERAPLPGRERSPPLAGGSSEGVPPSGLDRLPPNS
jgi:hypothetical protein